MQTETLLVLGHILIPGQVILILGHTHSIGEQSWQVRGDQFSLYANTLTAELMFHSDHTIMAIPLDKALTRSVSLQSLQLNSDIKISQHSCHSYELQP